MKYDKTPKDIELATGRDFVDICNELLDQGLSPTEIAKNLELRTTSYITGRMYAKKCKTPKDQALYPELVNTKIDNIEKEFPKLSGMTYKEFLYQKYIVEKLSGYEIGALLGFNVRTATRHIKSYGLLKTSSQARKDAVDKGLINYEKNIVKSRATRNKSMSNSNQQDMVRESIKQYIHEIIIDKKLENDIEAIIGFNEWGILKNKEVDIPIIITDINLNTYAKYSIEFNAKTWHLDDEKDTEKSLRLTANHWKHFIIERSLSNFINESKVKKIAEEIILDFLQNKSSRLEMSFVNNKPSNEIVFINHDFVKCV